MLIERQTVVLKLSRAVEGGWLQTQHIMKPMCVCVFMYAHVRACVSGLNKFTFMYISVVSCVFYIATFVCIVNV